MRKCCFSDILFLYCFLEKIHVYISTGFQWVTKPQYRPAKFNKEIADRRAETIAYHEAKKQEAQELAARIARIESETAARIAMEVEAAKREREERAAKVEAECLAYGYGRGEHYSSFSGWGNYCGD